MTDQPQKRRSQRYGKLVRGWDWRTTPERLAEMEAHRQALGIGKTEYMELAFNALLATRLPNQTQNSSDS